MTHTAAAGQARSVAPAAAGHRGVGSARRRRDHRRLHPGDDRNPGARDDRGARPPDVHPLAEDRRRADPRHPLHSDPALHPPGQPAVPARAVPDLRHAALRRLVRSASRRSADAASENRIRGPDPRHHRRRGRLDRGEPGSRGAVLVRGAEGADVLSQLRARRLRDGERHSSARQRRLHREDARRRRSGRRVLRHCRGADRQQRLQPPRSRPAGIDTRRAGAGGIPEVRNGKHARLRVRAASDRAERRARHAHAARHLPRDPLSATPLDAVRAPARRRVRLDRFAHRDPDVRRRGDRLPVAAPTRRSAASGRRSCSRRS